MRLLTTDSAGASTVHCGSIEYLRSIADWAENRGFKVKWLPEWPALFARQGMGAERCSGPPEGVASTSGRPHPLLLSAIAGIVGAVAVTGVIVWGMLP